VPAFTESESPQLRRSPARYFLILRMIGHLIAPEIKEMIDARNFAGLREVFADFSPADAADCIADLPEDEQAVVFRLLPHAQATEAFEYLEPEQQQRVLRAMGTEAAARILNDMSADDRTALLEDLPGAAVSQMLTLLSPQERQIAQTLLNYPEGSVGRLMTPDLIRVRDEWTVAQVLDHIRQFGRHSETLNVIYVVDQRGRLIDDVRIGEFLLAPLETPVSSIRDHTFVALRATDEEKTALDLFKRYDRSTLPVIDMEEKLLGIVTVDDMLDVQEEQTTEDIQRLGGMEALDEPYNVTTLSRMVRKRAMWLVVLFMGELLTASAMGHYEGAIEKAAMLAIFIPLIISSGGNAGSQATTLIIRAMSLGEVRLRDWWMVMRKECASGLLLGLVLGPIGVLRIVLWQNLGLYNYGPHYVLVALTVGIALLGVVVWGTISGAMLPFVLRRCGLDPAVASAPFVATIVDVTGLIIYFNAAVILLKGAVL
jgi:magnesium transporter